ncbi:MAG: glutamate racemase [Woeseiaceae bacterium]|jgi:glutamate racemase|nr:glutamate racemase [Woeseiaceae bacterium]
MTDDTQAPIGIFDSGVGGLTVLKAIRARLPGEHLVYLGDTARLPYGTKSPASIARYAEQATARLLDEDIRLLVVACNTASAVALEALRAAVSPLPVIGVVEPGAEAAVVARPGGRHLVLATETTVRLGAYRRAIARLDPAAEVRELPCELLVALAEEGWTEGVEAESVVRRYLAAVEQSDYHPDSIILGCTHFPLLRDVIAACAPAGTSIVDSAETTARFVESQLADTAAKGVRGALKLLATDGASRFARVGGQFLGERLEESAIEIVDL